MTTECSELFENPNAIFFHSGWRRSSTIPGRRELLGGHVEWSHSVVVQAVRELCVEDVEAFQTGNGLQGASTTRTRAPIGTRFGQKVVLGVFLTIDEKKVHLTTPKVMMRLTPV